ncbi:MAG TPA: hypothetical protein DDW50_01835, partial [Firmicutes bacterium]|nr:hypothetical protein [Bacillota bacterium]
MITKERLELVAPCGLDCGICELYLCKDNAQLYKALIEKGIPKEKIPCKGCRSIKGNCPAFESTCETYQCAVKNKIDFCSECNEFPCIKVQPGANRADSLPHNMKVFNLCTIKRIGLEAFIE